MQSLEAEHAILASGKTGQGVHEILEAIVHRLPAPKGDPDAPLKALIFDSWYDAYRGVVILTRVIDGEMRVGQKIRLMAAGLDLQIDQLGAFTPKPVPVDALGVGEAGFMGRTSRTWRTRRSATRSPMRSARPLRRFRASRN